MVTSLRILVLFSLVLGSARCAQRPSQELNTPKSGDSVRTQEKIIVRRDTVLKTSFEGLPAPTTLRYAQASRGQILVLPGYNYSDTGWCQHTRLCELAQEQGFDLVFVEMQRSLYLARYYKETRADLRKHPTRTWLMDSVIRKLFADGLLDRGKPTFVMGLSTGGRGAAMMALENPGIFCAAAALSGDFDPEVQKDDRLMIHSIGAYSQFPERWKGDNNIVRRIKEFDVPIYIGHGMADKMVPIAQSVRFADALQKQSPGLYVRTHFPARMAHNYVYWDSELEPVLAFFREFTSLE